MTIEQKALELVNAVKRERGGTALGAYHGWAEDRPETVALIRALEAHELNKSRHAAELREQAERFSEAVQNYYGDYPKDRMHPALSRFILAPVDPLVEVVGDVFDCNTAHTAKNLVADLRAALEARGLAIVKKEAVNG